MRKYLIVISLALILGACGKKARQLFSTDSSS